MTAFDKKVNQIAARHRWNIEKQARAAVPCYIIAAPTYEDTGKIVAVLNRCKGLYHETLTPIHYESWAVIFPGCRPGRAAGIHRGPFSPAWPSKCILAHFRPLERRRLLFFPRPLSAVSNLFVRILLNSDYSLFFSFHLWAFCSPLFVSESL